MLKIDAAIGLAEYTRFTLTPNLYTKTKNSTPTNSLSSRMDIFFLFLIRCFPASEWRSYVSDESEHKLRSEDVLVASS